MLEDGYCALVLMGIATLVSLAGRLMKWLGVAPHVVFVTEVLAVVLVITDAILVVWMSPAGRLVS
jgi:hypothetical protein